jgi:hypothetical protein
VEILPMHQANIPTFTLSIQSVEDRRSPLGQQLQTSISNGRES